MQALRLAIKRVPRTPSRAYSTKVKQAARQYSPIVGEEKVRDINDSIVRVDHAGEYGAQRIYDGQIAVLGNASCGNLLKSVVSRSTIVNPLVQEMRRQEREHYRTMRKLIRERRVRPSLLHPFWHVAGYTIGYGSALAGQEGAMACTVGVERVIASHYNDQLRELVQHTPSDTELRGIIKRFRDEEMDHHDWGADAGGKGTTLVDSFTQLVDWGTKLAVAIAKRI